MPTGLIRRGARYSVRRRIPLDLVEHYGRQELTRALGTSDPAEARRLLPLVWAELDTEFEHVRSTPQDEGDEDSAEGEFDYSAYAASPGPMDVGARTAELLDAMRLRRDKAVRDGNLKQFTKSLKLSRKVNQRMMDGTYKPVHSIAEHEAKRNAARALLKGEGVVAVRASAASVARDEENPTLAELYALWTKHQERPRSTLQGMTRAVDRFEQVVGARRIKSISRKDMTLFTDKMREPGVVTPTGVSIPNMNTTLSLLSALFGFAVRRNLIEANPATNTQIQDSRRAREKRRDFDAPALAAIFGSPIYASGERPEGGAGEAAYWIPLLALYTGARINELCQLHPANVVQEGYVDPKGKTQKAWVIRIEQDKAKGQRVKTEGSERRIPVHADLIKLGFIAYAQAQQGKARLFDEVKTGVKEGRIAGNWGRWFGRHLRTTCGVTDERMTFHSFRHTFKHQARQALIAPDVHNALTGHETRSAADAYGGLSYPLYPLVEGMKKFRVADFKLPAPSPAAPKP